MTFTLKKCGIVGHKTFTSNNWYYHLYHKKLPKQTFISLVNHLLQHILDLNNHPNLTRRGFTPLILEEDLDLMDGPSVNTAGDITYFWDYD